MTAKEAALYRWLEVFTIRAKVLADVYTLADASAVAAGWELDYAVSRRYVKRVGVGLVLTPAGEGWFETRAAAIRADCEVGFHQFAPKTPFGRAEHCMWCGACLDSPCGECVTLLNVLPQNGADWRINS